MPSLIGRLRDLRGEDRDLDAEVRQALVGTLYASISSLLIGCAVGAGVALIVASQAADPWITLCACAIAVVAVTRVGSAIAYHRLTQAKDHDAAGRWERGYELGAWSYSALIGLLALLALMRTADPALHLVACATATGYAGGVSGRNCGRPKIAISQMSLAALPVAGGLVLWPDPLYRTLGVATALYVLAMIEITLQLHGVVRRAIITTNEKRKAAEALQLALTAAEDANDAKTTFLTTMSHEIRTPLNGVLGMAQALATERLTAEQSDRVEVIRQSGETLLAILNDVLDLAKVEAGKFELEAVPFDLGALIGSAHAAFQDLAFAKGVDFTVCVDGDAAGVYRGDPTRLQQIANNLISNALKFTRAGAVRIVARHDGERLRLSVSDTGIGIAAGNLDKIFEKFLQADASTTRQFGGTGLGLALCRELAQLMGGDIEVRSRFGEGSEFIVSLPLHRLEGPEAQLAPQTSPTPATTERPDREQLRILCADDNEVNRLVLRTLLDQIGADHLVVGDGQEVVSAWETADFDLILMDVQMPVMDGIAAATAIRVQEQATRRPRTPIIALTANVMAHQTARYIACGMDDVVAKPIDLNALVAAMERQLEPAPPAQVA